MKTHMTGLLVVALLVSLASVVWSAPQRPKRLPPAKRLKPRRPLVRPGSQQPAVPLTDDARAVAKTNNAFALDLYGRVTEPGKNVFFSPFSISTALAMTYVGARGETAEEMAQTLRFGLPPEKLHPAFSVLIKNMNSRQEQAAYDLVVANALWGQKGYGFLPEFLKATRVNYGAGLREVDYEADVDGSRLIINKWVAEKTNDKIKDLVPAGALDALTRLVLTNAIYFLGTWEHPFEKGSTRDAPFTLADGNEVVVPMMHQSERFGYMQTDLFQALEMSYKGHDLSMVVFLPRKGVGLGKVEEGLTAENLGQWLGKLRNRQGRVWFPRFEMTCSFGLAKTLGKMGMAKAFSPGEADFSGMTGKRDLYISKVLHKAFIAVDEKGTEAAAATAVVMRLTAVPVPEEPFQFRADHPFLFVIRDRRSDALLFLGKVANPKE